MATLRVHSHFLKEQWKPARAALLGLEFDDR
jgi:hypothetical protein